MWSEALINAPFFYHVNSICLMYIIGRYGNGEPNSTIASVFAYCHHKTDTFQIYFFHWLNCSDFETDITYIIIPGFIFNQCKDRGSSSLSREQRAINLPIRNNEPSKNTSM